MKAWITRYALSTGIFTSAGEIFGIGGRSFKTVDGEGHLTGYHHGKDWHRTEAAAKARFEEMRAAKLKSLDKQRARIANLPFKVKGDIHK